MSYQCPWEGCNSVLETERGMKSHHSQVHNSTIKQTVICDVCGSSDEKLPSEVNPDNNFCSRDCFYEFQDERVEKFCDWCGESVTRSQSDIEDGGNVFCNKECNSKWKSENIVGENHHQYEGINVGCSWCGGSLIRRPSEIEQFDNHFCSDDCESSWMSENRIGEDHPGYNSQIIECEICGNERERSQSYIDNHDNLCCGDECRGVWLSKNRVGEDHPGYNGGDVVYGDEWTEELKEEIRESQNYHCYLCDVHQDELRMALDVHHKQKARNINDPTLKSDSNNLVALCRSCHTYAEPMTPLMPQPNREGDS